MDDLDALLEDLQAVVPRTDRPSSKTPAASLASTGSGSSGSSNISTQRAVNGGSAPLALAGVNGTTSSTNNMLSSSGGGTVASTSNISGAVSPGMTNASSNLAELDSLLESLNSPSLGMDLDDEAIRALGMPDGGVSSKGGQGSYKSSPAARPDVGNLLTDLDNAVSVRSSASPPNNMAQQSNSASPPVPPSADASSATRDLDALMASLSDFQMTTGGGGGGGGGAVSNKASDASANQLYAHPKAIATGSDASLGAVSTASQGFPPAAPPEEDPSARLSQLDSMLGHLQSDLSRQGITSSSKGTCSACQKEIVGQVITALGRTWHPHHFICVCCKAELATRNFFEREGKAYCEKDYHEKFAPKCAYCDGPILERCMTALGKTWHPEHFICAHCGNPFGPSESFHEKDGQPYCRNDYYELFAPKCGACERPIFDSFVSALKKQWHPECFNCMECGEAFKGGNFFEHDLMPYCEKHYYNRQGAVCSQCKKPVTGRCITAMGHKYHPEHFVCVFCMKQLSMGTFKEHGERPYCMKCYGKLFG